MAKKVAVAFIHGIGQLDSDYRSQKALKEKVEGKLSNASKDDVAIHLIDWAKTFEHRESELRNYADKHELKLVDMRGFMLSFMGDTIAYQIAPRDPKGSGYSSLHFSIAQQMHNLAEECEPTAPLIVVSHSLGSVIASNYFYDLQHDFHYSLGTGDEDEIDCNYVRRPDNLIADAVTSEIMRSNTAIERGETLAYFFTLGSPLAIYNMVYRKPQPEGYGLPILVPHPELKNFHRELADAIEDKKKKSLVAGGEKAWLNFYHKNDMIAFPLAGLNKCYKREVQDIEAKIKGWKDWTPLAHREYSLDESISKLIADKVEDVLRFVK